MQVVIEYGIDKTDITFVATPGYHKITPDAWLYPHFMAGTMVVLQAELESREVLESLEKHDGIHRRWRGLRLSVTAESRNTSGAQTS